MNDEFLQLLVSKYTNNYELGSVIRSYFSFYEGYKYSYDKEDIIEMFMRDVLKTEKTFKS